MKNTGRIVFFVTIITMLAKVLTLASVLMYQTFFGYSNTALNIYTYSVNTPNYIFTAIGTCLTTIVVPIYSSLIASNEKERSKKFIDDMISITGLFVIVLIVVAYIITPLYVNLSGFKEELVQYNYAVFAVRTFLPIMFFFSMRDIFAGVLQSNNRFKIVSAVSLPSSLALIIYIVFFAKRFGVTGLIFASIIGLSAQTFFLLPSVLKTGYRYKPSFDFKSKDILKGAKLIPTVLLGTSAYQVNMLYNNNLSSQFGTGSIVDLVSNTMLIPVLTLIYSITSIYYPRLSKEWNKDDKSDYRKSLYEIISAITFFLLPATFGLILLRHDVMNLLIMWQKVTVDEIKLASDILGLYSLSIVFVGLKETFDKAFYSQKSTIPSGVMGIIMMVTNILVNTLLKNRIGTYSIPIAYTISSIVGSGGLYVLLKSKIGKFDKEIYTNLLKCFLSACIMGVAVYGISKICWIYIDPNRIIGRLLKLMIPVISGVLIYFISTYLLKVKQTVIFINKAKAILGRRQN